MIIRKRVERYEELDNQIRNIVYDYATDFTKWLEIAELL